MGAKGDLGLTGRINMNSGGGGCLDHSPSCHEENKGRGAGMKQAHREN